MARRPGRQRQDMRELAKQLDIPLPDSDDLNVLQTALHGQIAERLKGVRKGNPVRYKGRPWTVADITRAQNGRKGKVYILRDAKDYTQIEVSETSFLKGIS